MIPVFPFLSLFLFFFNIWDLVIEDISGIAEVQILQTLFSPDSQVRGALRSLSCLFTIERMRTPSFASFRD